MTSTTALVLCVVALAVGTFACRVAGPLLRARFEPSARAQQLIATSAVVLLAALVVTAALLDGDRFAGLARPAGVAVGGVLAWKKAPFLVVVVAAAVTAAGLRLFGVS